MSIVADVLRVSIELELLAARAQAAGHTTGDAELAATGRKLAYVGAQAGRIARQLAERARVLADAERLPAIDGLPVRSDGTVDERPLPERDRRHWHGPESRSSRPT